MKKIISILLALVLSLIVSVSVFASEGKAADSGVVLYDVQLIDNLNEITYDNQLLAKKAVQYTDGSILEVSYTGTKPEAAATYALSAAGNTNYVSVTASGRGYIGTNVVVQINLTTNFYYNYVSNITGISSSSVSTWTDPDLPHHVENSSSVITSGNDWASHNHWTRETMEFTTIDGYTGTRRVGSIWTQVYSNGENYHADGRA